MANFTLATGAGFGWTSGGVQTAMFSAAANVNFASMAADAEDTQTITVTGAATGATPPSVELGWTSALPAGIVVAQAWVSAANTVSIRVRNASAGVIDPAVQSVRAVVRHWA